MIKNITIQNIKGYGYPPVTLDVELKTNRVNILFAPNGTGKSSLAAAFSSLKRGTLSVDKNLKFHKDETLSSSLSLELNDVVYTADSTKNEISPVLSCWVIKSGIDSEATLHNMGKFATAISYIDITDIEIGKVVKLVSTGYSINAIKRNFGKNKKILQNLGVEMESPKFLHRLKFIYTQLDTFLSASSRRALIENVLQKINNLRGNEQEVLAAIDENWLSEIETEPRYQSIVQQLALLYPNDSPCNLFLRFFQLTYHWKDNKMKIKSAIAYWDYIDFKNHIDRELKLLDTTWKNIHTEEVKDKLVVRFPHADEISNGQRDLLTFVVNIIKFKVKIRPEYKYLLLIDEVFDYLDDANLIAAQYYLTDFLNLSNNNLYLCILSHLNPYTFRSYVFSEKRINPQYLRATVPTATRKMLAFIAFRETMNQEGKRGDANKLQLYHNLSHDLFHYNHLVSDYSADIATYKTDRNLDETWGQTAVLHQILIDEVNKYLSDQTQYDPYAVAMALRLRVEKMMYEQLQNQNQKTHFIDQKMTKNKFAYCEDNGVEVPDVYNIVSAIHNEADHVKMDHLTNTYVEKPMVYKLQHVAIKGILKKIFGWEGHNLNTNVID